LHELGSHVDAEFDNWKLTLNNWFIEEAINEPEMFALVIPSIEQVDAFIFSLVEITPIEFGALEELDITMSEEDNWD
jgi:hypothetical protein